ncbi:MAG: ABC transporter transmembrane domain-containing protein, partial [Deltaproteobacteria bacterium]|nr:ABC transporter transmembrane domain-containing protein [Deltaproteobacteria bacterium]
MTDPIDDNKAASPEAWLRGEARIVRRPLATAVLLGVAGAVLIIIQARILAGACHDIVINGAGRDSIRPAAVIIALMALLRGIVAWLAEHCLIRAATVVKQLIIGRLYRHLQLLLPSGVTGEDAGTLAEIVTSGVEGIESYLTRFLPQLILAALLPLLMLAAVMP